MLLCNFKSLKKNRMKKRTRRMKKRTKRMKKRTKRMKKRTKRMKKKRRKTEGCAGLFSEALLTVLTSYNCACSVDANSFAFNFFL